PTPSGTPAPPGHRATRAVGVRLPALLPLAPRDAESTALLVPPRLLPRVLRHSVRVAARSLVQRPAGRGPTHDLRRDGDLLHLLCGVPLLPRGRPPLHLRPRPQRGHVRLAGAGHPVAARPR